MSNLKFQTSNINRLSNQQQPFQNSLQFIQRQHIGTIAQGFRRARVRFNKQAIYPNGDARFGNRFNQCRTTACDAARLIGLLQRMRTIQHHRRSQRLHDRNAPKIHHQILIAKRRAAVSMTLSLPD